MKELWKNHGDLSGLSTIIPNKSNRVEDWTLTFYLGLQNIPGIKHMLQSKTRAVKIKVGNYFG